MNPTTRQVIEFNVRNGALSIGRTTGPALVPIDENRFRQGQTEYRFGSGEHTGFDLLPPGGGRPLPFEWHAPVVASATVLAPYAGEYFSEELNARYRVTASDSTVSLRTGTSNPVTARLVFADTFVGGGWTIQFERKRGQVAGFVVTNQRVRGVRFDRVPGR